ncbi:MAG: M48 family metallopeptidase [Robiginitomaculum sp.]|nr:M48 family metallopeptidase [Robiginitomaculum sp.]
MIEALPHDCGPVSVLIHRKSKRITLRLDHASRNAQLVLPHKKFLGQGKKLLLQRSEWLSQQWEKLPLAMPFIAGRIILLGGEKTELVFETGRGKAREQNGKFIVPATQEAAFADRVRRALIERARISLQEQVSLHSERLNCQPQRITVRDTRSRWGSCSAAGNLNFSWRLICAPAFVLSYVAAHEVAHLREANHSFKFWDLVKQSFGDPAPARKYLRANAPELFAIGAEEQTNRQWRVN